MTPAKKTGNYVLTGRSATLTLGLPDSDETLTLNRGEPTEVPSAFAEQVEQHEDIYPEGQVPEDAITGLPATPPPAAVQPADEPPPAPPTPDDTGADAIQQTGKQPGDTEPA